MNLTILKGELFVIAVGTPARRFKLFQIKFKPDGTVLVPFPYYKDPSAQLIEGRLEANRDYSTGLTVCGPVATHRVKYTHHIDGEAHFSQDGKILTRVRKHANSLPHYGGHLFTVQLQGLTDFAPVTDRDSKDRRRTIVCLDYPTDVLALKFVAHLYSLNQVARMSFSKPKSGPWLTFIADGKARTGVFLYAGDFQGTGHHVLTLSYEQIPSATTTGSSIFTFMGGFDQFSTALDQSKDTTFLMLISPAGRNAAEAARSFGTVDCKPNSN
jgi:hypothetical protein